MRADTLGLACDHGRNQKSSPRGGASWTQLERQPSLGGCIHRSYRWYGAADRPNCVKIKITCNKHTMPANKKKNKSGKTKTMKREEKGLAAFSVPKTLCFPPATPKGCVDPMYVYSKSLGGYLIHGCRCHNVLENGKLYRRTLGLYSIGAPIRDIICF